MVVHWYDTAIFINSIDYIASLTLASRFYCSRSRSSLRLHYVILFRANDSHHQTSAIIVTFLHSVKARYAIEYYGKEAPHSWHKIEISPDCAAG